LNKPSQSSLQVVQLFMFTPILCDVFARKGNGLKGQIAGLGGGAFSGIRRNT